MCKQNNNIELEAKKKIDRKSLGYSAYFEIVIFRTRTLWMETRAQESEGHSLDFLIRRKIDLSK